MLRAWYRRNAKIGIAVLAAVVGVGAVGVFANSPSNPFRNNLKARHADEKTVAFVRPGLNISVTRVEIATDGTVRVLYRLTDPQGQPLDRDGVFTPGAIATSFVLARIPQDQTQYVSYTTRSQTSPINGKTAIQAGADAGGLFTKVNDGEYAYTFATKLPSNYDRNATHSVLAYGSRNLAEFELGTNYADTVFSWVPGGARVTKTRDIIRTSTCNNCHADMGFHGGSRKSLEGCILCHTPQTTDPDTGNTVDMPVMVHKIHMGAELPSVQGGKRYCIIGNRQSENCYEKVEFVAGPNNCKVCHVTNQKMEEKPAQAMAHLTNPTRAACGACHDDVNFETGVNHANMPQPNDTRCSTCHTPQGELEFDKSITGAHVQPTFSESLPGVQFEIVSIDNGAAGRQPRVTFSVKDKKGNPVKPVDMTALSLVLAGPTSDYATYVSETARNAQDIGGGRYAHTFTASIPAAATGSYTIGMEGYKNFDLMGGTPTQLTVRDAGVNVTRTFAVDGRAVVPRRQVVVTEKCNACHDFLSLHGGNRNRVEQCVLCHNPTMTDSARRPATMNPPESINMANLIHRIHSGKSQQRDFTIYGFGNAANTYNEAGYPGILTECEQCHVNNSQQLPLRNDLLPVTDPRAFLTKPGAAGAACMSCHSGREAAVHVQVNSNELGESCGSCHGPSGDFSVDKVHAR